jgi:hypothetical protein
MLLVLCRSSFFDQIVRVWAGHGVLWAAQSNLGLGEGTAHGRIRYAKPRCFGQHIGQALVGPQAERQVQAARTLAHQVEETFLIGGRDFRRCARAWGICKTGKAFGVVALQPAAASFCRPTDDHGNLGDEQTLLGS